MDWCCLPVFDSPSVFGRLLDEERGGHFSIVLEGQTESSQAYFPHTNILVTTLTSPDGSLEVYDYMPRFKPDRGGYHTPPDVVRLLRPKNGAPRAVVEYRPQLNYAQGDSIFEQRPDYIKTVSSGRPYESLYLYSDLDLDAVLEGRPLTIDRDRFLLVSYNEKLKPPNHQSIMLDFERTKVYWMNWVAESRHFHAWDGIIERSALVLKLLAYQNTGAVLAAVTTGLPEQLGGARNWDYRYCWLRDAAMVVKIFSLLGHYRVSTRFLRFVRDVVPYKDEKIQIMYGIHREKRLPERELPWLAGYGGSKPVRVGNAAFKQKQNDIYGVVMDTIYQCMHDHLEAIENLEGLWTVVRTLVRHVGHNWKNRDAGIWEIRGERKHFVFSKVLCWVAVDRAIKIAMLLEKPEYAEQWAPLRAAIKNDVMKKGWNEKVGAFTQAYGEEYLDAANLLIEHYGFIDAQDLRYVQTVNLSYERLCRNGLMYRYTNSDDFGLPTTSFTVCTFWMIKSLHRIGRTELAKEMVDELLARGNHLGLFSEDMDFETKRLLGNFPQAYSHLALIDTVLTLSGVQNGDRDDE